MDSWYVLIRNLSKLLESSFHYMKAMGSMLFRLPVNQLQQ
jgi:hypothetical protein